MPVLRAFMDDISLMTTSKVALQGSIAALKCARMKLKPQKSRGLVIKGGKCIDEQPLKTLGSVYNSSVTDRQAQDDLKKKVNSWYKKLASRC